MKNLFEVLDEYLARFDTMLQSDGLAGCENISTDLITFCVLTDFDDGILIGEIFESVFSQIRPLFHRFEISEEEKKSIKEEMSKNIAKVAESYKKKDKQDLYDALKNLRAVATKFQIKCYQMLKRSPEAEPFLKLSGRRYR